MSTKVLIIEDETAIRDMLGLIIQKEGFSSMLAADYQSGIDALNNEHLPDLVLLDWMLPGGSGIRILEHMRRNQLTRQIPVIMLTAKDSELDKVQGLNAGADDYIVKPFSPNELVARVKAILRRLQPTSAKALIEVADLVLDPSSHRVEIAGEVINLGPTEFKLLHFFLTHQERVYDREQLLNKVWGTNVYVEERTVDVHIRRLRKAISYHDCDKLIQTVRGMGYRFSVKAD